MSIIRYIKESNTSYAYLDVFSDQFKTEKEKQGDSWVKNTMDYFSNKAYSEYIRNRDSFVKNYDLMKGILRPEDFYQEPEVKSFTQMLEENLALPTYVKHYSIITTPINELVGEISKRPDTARMRAFDDDSKAEELQFKTDLLQKYVLSQAKQKIVEKLALSGQEMEEEEIEQMALKDVKDELDSYTSVAEKWANHVLTCQKVDFNLKEKSEDCFRDMLISAREFYHLYEDNSKLGYNIEVENPKNVWFLTTPDRKYISDPSGRAQGAYAAGTVHVLELSEIIESIPDITKEEIDYLRSTPQDYGAINARESNLGNPNATPGQDSIMYDTYDPLVAQARMLIESEIVGGSDGLGDLLGLTSNVSSFGYKYVVVRSYWLSKKKIGKLIYIDEMGNEQSLLVDENYKSGTIPTQLSLEWGWINQWYQGIKVGSDIYHVKPFKLLNYCPIIGTTYEIKNTEARSLVDLMKPFQVLYNVCMNQLYRLLEKEIGNVASINIRRIPKLKDGDDQDAIEVWMMDAKEAGVIFDDDSPENTKAPVSNTSVAKNIDLTRTNEIQGRYNLAVQLKNECWELIGMSRQRMGSVTASESATGTNAAITQSYSQTEPLFIAHEYVLLQLYQAIVDASQFVESTKPQSTLSYITSEGESAFIQVNGNDLKLRDIKVFPTNRPEDTQMFNELRSLAQPAMQNGADFFDVAELWATKSMREIRKVLKDLRDKNDALKQKTIEQKDEEIKNQREIAQAQMEQVQNLKQQETLNQNYQNDLERSNKKEIALIATSSKAQPVDNDNNSVPDVLEISKLSNDVTKTNKEYELKMADLLTKSQESANKLALGKEKLANERANMKNDLQISLNNAKGRANKPKK